MTQGTNTNLQAAGNILTSFAGTLKAIRDMSMVLGALLILIGAAYLGIALTLLSVVLIIFFCLFIWIASIFMGAIGEVLLSLVSIEKNLFEANQTLQQVAGVSPSPVTVPSGKRLYPVGKANQGDVSPTPESVPSEKQCSNCGSSLESEATFCEACGKKVE